MDGSRKTCAITVEYEYINLKKEDDKARYAIDLLRRKETEKMVSCTGASKRERGMVGFASASFH